MRPYKNAFEFPYDAEDRHRGQALVTTLAFDTRLGGGVPPVRVFRNAKLLLPYASIPPRPRAAVMG
jgi:hypothetical protein